MTDTRDETDIAWMRRLAEEGGQGPMKGAAILAAAGLIYGSASLAHWAVVSGLIGGGQDAINLAWLGATGLFLVLVVAVNLRIRGTAGVTTTAGRGAGAAWAAVGWGVFALFTSLGVIGSRLGGDAVALLMGLVPSIIMVFYGLGWAVTAALQKSKPLGLLAAASFVAAPLLALLAGTDAQYLAYAAGLFGLMALPGLLLMRADRS